MSLICYCTGGIGNRLRPLASCYALTKQENQKLFIFWENTDVRCQAHFSDLFENSIPRISSEELSQIDDVSIFGEESFIQTEAIKNKRNVLKNLAEKYGLKGKRLTSYQTKNAILYSCEFQKIPNELDFIKNLKPIKPIKKIIDEEINRLSLSKKVIGVHARGTDFFLSPKYYIKQINAIADKDTTIFLCSDEEAMEEAVKNGVHCKVLTRSKKAFAQKQDNNDDWNKMNDLITLESAQDAIVDMYLLSQTNLKIYSPRSTFTIIAKLVRV